MSEELNQFLKAHGLSKMQFARIFGVSRRTAIYWAKGQQNPPNAVMILIRAIEAGKVKLEWAQEQVELMQWGR